MNGSNRDIETTHCKTNKIVNVFDQEIYSNPILLNIPMLYLGNNVKKDYGILSCCMRHLS